jgi:predicted XRE-type DNA-binding protein
MKKTNSKVLVPAEFIERKIYFIRGQKVMLDSDLAELYSVPTSRLNEAVKRNIKRFPKDFMFQLNKNEINSVNMRSQNVTASNLLISQIAISKVKRGGRRKIPYVFTEQGVAMLSSVLNSTRAIEMNIAIMRVFVRIRELMLSHKDIARRLDDLEQKYDGQFAAIFDAIRRLIVEKEKPRPKIGFNTKL